MNWTREFHGLSHYGKFSTKSLWLTVERFPTGAILKRWFAGCGFSPQETWHGSVESAKRAGEKAIKLGQCYKYED